MLVEQQKLSAHRKIVAPMSDVEKQINAQLLQKAAALGISISGTGIGAGRA
jgi:ribose 5-phosphate isomerase RpiB